jgi:hypothetical protein
MEFKTFIPERLADADAATGPSGEGYEGQQGGRS